MVEAQNIDIGSEGGWESKTTYRNLGCRAISRGRGSFGCVFRPS
jgi:hypothetical protein